jgi:hypothetical protein
MPPGSDDKGESSDSSTDTSSSGVPNDTQDRGEEVDDRAAFAAERLSNHSDTAPHSDILEESESLTNTSSASERSEIPEEDDSGNRIQSLVDSVLPSNESPSPSEDQYVEENTTSEADDSPVSDKSNPVVDPEESTTIEDSPEEQSTDEETTQRTYIRIVPARAELKPETVVQQIYGFHSLGEGSSMPFNLDSSLPILSGSSSYEFIIHKPADEARFNFYFGTSSEEELERLESAIRSQYPGDYQFETDSFDLPDQFDETPHLCRWEGKEEKRGDWMMLLSQYTEDKVDRSPLSNLLETAIRTNDEWAFQAVFDPKHDYSRKATRAKRNIKMGAQNIVGLGIQQFLDNVGGVSEYEERERHRGGSMGEVGESLHDTQGQGTRWKTDRLTQIDLKQPDSTFRLSLRAASPDETIIRSVQDAFNQLSGSFYHVEGNYLGRDDDEFQRMSSHELTPLGPVNRLSKTKPRLVVSPDELANFITVPGMDALPKASRGASGSSPSARSPLTSPDETVFDTFNDGMSIGQVSTVHEDERQDRTEIEPTALSNVNDWWEAINSRESVHLRATDLTEHYLRAATTGSGKTVATINDILTAYHNLEGPIFLIDPSGGDMCENYLRSHRYIFEDTDDVEYIQIPGENGEVPALPFFDIRPLIYRAGYSRETAIQNKIDHYFELMRYILGRDNLEQAFVANEILNNLIAALFDESRQDDDEDDEENGDDDDDDDGAIAGGDSFAISDLFNYAAAYSRNQHIPEVENKDIRALLERHLDKNATQFDNTTDAVMNRITKIHERDFIWRMMDYDPDWEDERDWYKREECILDFLELMNSNKVVLIDTGNLRQESQRVFTALFLSHLITALKSLDTPTKDNYTTNVIIEEAAPIARSELVHQELLPEGRKFDLSVGLIMQYPEQVLGEKPKRNETAYREVLNNVNTKIIGNVSSDDRLPKALFHEALDAAELRDRIAGLPRGEFLVQLPATGFQQNKPEVLTLRPHPIPPGHNESSTPIRSKLNTVRQNTKNRYCISPDDIANRIDPNIENAESESDIGSTASNGDDQEGKPPKDLTPEECAFLRNVIRAWNGRLEFYQRGDPMNKSLDRQDLAPELSEHGYLDNIMIVGEYSYYWPTDKTLSHFDDLEIEWGTEQGDPRESPRHKIIVALLERYYENRGADVNTYVGVDETKQVTFDLIATRRDQDGETAHRVIEVETCADISGQSTNPMRKEAVISDYEKMADFAQEIDNAKTIWVVEDTDAAHHLLDILEDAGYISHRPTREVQNYNKIMRQLECGPGLDAINGFQIVVDNVLGMELSRNSGPTDSS